MQKGYEYRDGRWRVARDTSLRKPIAFLMCLAMAVAALVVSASPSHAATCAGVVVVDVDACKTSGGSLGPTGKVAVGGLGLAPQGVVSVQSIADVRAIAVVVSQLNSAPKTLRIGTIDRNGDGKYRRIGTLSVSGWPASGFFYGTTLQGVPSQLGRGDLIVISLKRETFRWKHTLLAGKLKDV